MTVYIGAVAAVSAVISTLFYNVSKRIDLCKKSLIATVSVLNALFCAIFPLLIALISGQAKNGAPSRNLGAVAVYMSLLTLLYLFIIIWRVMLRSPSLKFNMPFPIPEQYEKMPQNIEYKKDSVDTAANIDKMGNITEIQQDNAENKVILLINLAFNSLEGGKLEEAAMNFYSALENKPPLSLEIQIAIQLGMIYSELGQAALSYDILNGYYNDYQDQLSKEDKMMLEAGINMVGPVVANIGGDGDEKN